MSPVDAEVQAPNRRRQVGNTLNPRVATVCTRLVVPPKPNISTFQFSALTRGIHRYSRSPTLCSTTRQTIRLLSGFYPDREDIHSWRSGCCSSTSSQFKRSPMSSSLTASMNAAALVSQYHFLSAASKLKHLVISRRPELTIEKTFNVFIVVMVMVTFVGDEYEDLVKLLNEVLSRGPSFEAIDELYPLILERVDARIKSPERCGVG
ncbi:hypothetical protein BDN72DRAFT_883819 [Pluteus cervinus]|uniref:Uncharacterized protein n=1 Tax=Pluteus cervinus TaxID=181527 RepID=A0ACD3A2W3_9AGAR|nr:hypothetical protein BDN72DRAFT_883819 [Pluteus cervinus]